MQVTITYFGVEATGRNVTEAKREAGKRIEQMIAGDYAPVLLSHRGQAILVYRTPESGWSSVIVCDDAGLREGRLSGSSLRDDRREALRSAAEHLAQLTWQPEDGTSAPQFLIERGDKHSADDFRRWAEFQLRYREAIAKGMEHFDAHSYAGRNPGRRDLWETELCGK